MTDGVRPARDGVESAAVGDAHALGAGLCRALLAERREPGWWRGELSASALSTALACFALHVVKADASAVQGGANWLCGHVNADGGWGDTPESPSNVSTTLICWAVLSALHRDGVAGAGVALPGATAWLGRTVGGLAFPQVARYVVAAYGNDRTFSAPILALCALAGVFPEQNVWTHVPRLPFELALLPRSAYRLARLPVVSYALPALIAVGVCRHRCATPRSGRWRECAAAAALRRLEALQPRGGGFLEAIPLTAFVVMCLAGAGERHSPVVAQGVAFLSNAARPGGAWAIDSDLSGWVTALAARAIVRFPGEHGMTEACRREVAARICAAQHTRRHPFTGATPGGWGWTDLPGGVPDADDTAAALLSLAALAPQSPEVIPACREGVAWLIGLQNRDGGMPTFCRGWGKLPFDRSCPDISAHALESLIVLCALLPEADRQRVQRSERRLVRYLVACQSEQGAWLPLWFGSQGHPARQNPVFGTARVVQGLSAWSGGDAATERALARARDWLIAAQDTTGGWGSDVGILPTIEETGMALAALAGSEGCEQAQARAVAWLARHVGVAETPAAAPIGLYFARLWYSERLYPWIFALEGCTRFLRAAGGKDRQDARNSQPGLTER